MATVINKKSSPATYSKGRHVLGTRSFDRNSYDSGVVLARVRGNEDHCEWVRVEAASVQNDDTSWTHEVHSAASALAETSTPDKPIDFKMVKRGDRMVSQLTTSEEERAKRRPLRKAARRLKYLKRKHKINVVKSKSIFPSETVERRAR